MTSKAERAAELTAKIAELRDQLIAEQAVRASWYTMTTRALVVKKN